jgi:rhamnopyranosyl-N-acetylglucosaminyl-diphospho-decaprenol beta-1,3/1,4-galactofuranosyltransferase
MSVCAVVLTFNRKHLLVECLEALFAQTHPVERIVLVDNASTDGTLELLGERGLLDRPEVELVRLERNLGSSGGFNRGLARARELDADWVWIMDDDAEPPPDALAALLASPAASDPGTVALCGVVVDRDGEIETWIHRGLFKGRLRALPLDAYRPGHTPRIDYCSFVGPLVRMAAVRAVDPPVEEFFIWGDDVEYCLRLRTRGEIRVVPESRIVHKDVGQSHANRRSRFWNAVLRQQIVPATYEAYWRNLFGLRNYVWIKKVHQGQGPVAAAGVIGQFVVRALLYEERPLRRVAWLVRYGIDGRRDRFVNIPPQRWAAAARSRRAGA